MPHSNTLVNALLAEDRLADITLTKRILEFEHVHLNLEVVRDGEELLDFLHHRPPYEDSFYPDIIFLDLNLQKIHGKEILAIIKKDPKLKSIPVIILSGSDNDSDMAETLDSGALAYIVKPIGLNKLQSALHGNINFIFKNERNNVYFCKIPR